MVVEDSPDVAQERAADIAKCKETIDSMSLVASSWNIQATKYNAALIEGINAFKVRVATFKSAFEMVEEAGPGNIHIQHMDQDIAQLYDEYNDLNNLVNHINSEKRNLKRKRSNASDDPDEKHKATKD